MKFIFKSLLCLMSISILLAAGCNNAKENKSTADNVTNDTIVADADIRGQWYIENIVFNDSNYVRPDDVAPGASQYIVFEDSTYYIMTNCNSISGVYKVKGDSITFVDGVMTEMACDNMDPEDALQRILPNLATIDIQNDSVIRLNGSAPAEYILLRKTNPEIK